MGFMRITEIEARKGKRKCNLIVVGVTQEDFDSLEETVLMGEFHRGQVFFVKEEREAEFIELLKREKR
jgi:hypothetical protein